MTAILEQVWPVLVRQFRVRRRNGPLPKQLQTSRPGRLRRTSGAFPIQTRLRCYFFSPLFEGVSALALLSFFVESFPESLLESALPSDDSVLAADPSAGFLA